VIGLDKDEREEFLKRENELSDQLAEREGALVAAEKLVKELKEELAFLKEQEAVSSKVKFAFKVSHHALTHPCCVTGKQSNVCPAKRAPPSGRETRVR
jgi:predicted AAA+ superfamily ATPase